MGQIIKITKNDPLKVAKRIFYLAWKACPYSPSMVSVAAVDEDSLWDTIIEINHNKTCLETVYIHGRSLKLIILVGEEDIEIIPATFRKDKNAFAGVYTTANTLVVAAIKSLIKTPSYKTTEIILRKDASEQSKEAFHEMKMDIEGKKLKKKKALIDLLNKLKDKTDDKQKKLPNRDSNDDTSIGTPVSNR